VGAGNGQGNFTIVLNPNRTASNTRDTEATGTWEVVNGEMRIHWSNGWTDVLRRRGTMVIKYAFAPGEDVTTATANNATMAKKEP
jgi:hypothetical protein